MLHNACNSFLLLLLLLLLVLLLMLAIFSRLCWIPKT